MPLPRECPVGPRRKRKTPKKNLEGHVVRECLAFLQLHPDVVYMERRNTGMVLFEGGGAIRFGSKGAADIWCLMAQYKHRDNCRIGLSNGVTACCPEDWCENCSDCKRLIHVEIEAKRADGKGRQSADQKEFQKFCDDYGIPYILTTSAEKLAEELARIST